MAYLFISIFAIFGILAMLWTLCVTFPGCNVCIFWRPGVAVVVKSNPAGNVIPFITITSDRNKKFNLLSWNVSSIHLYKNFHSNIYIRRLLSGYQSRKNVKHLIKTIFSILFSTVSNLAIQTLCSDKKFTAATDLSQLAFSCCQSTSHGI